jgi:hypothetical protein
MSGKPGKGGASGGAGAIYGGSGASRGNFRRNANVHYNRTYGHETLKPGTANAIAKEVNRITSVSGHTGSTTRHGAYVLSPRGNVVGSLHILGPSSHSGMIHGHTTPLAKTPKETVRATPHFTPTDNISHWTYKSVGGPASRYTGEFTEAFATGVGTVMKGKKYCYTCKNTCKGGHCRRERRLTRKMRRGN